MNQKDYKEIANIIKSNIFRKDNMSVIDTYAIKELADYFEREVKRINAEKRYRYFKEHQGNISQKALLSFNKKQFLKEAGVEE